ncbi:MAG TPA: HEAT repeat domain-containing protein [Planctomycetota bacterium]|nr:HEAT repeat domain-containing protein [Planctomycetota bacterium]
MKGPEDRDLKLAVLKGALFGDDVQSVYAAISVMRSMKGRDVAQILESYLTSHLSSEKGASSVAAEALGEIGDPGSLAPLTDALRSTDEDVRYSSAEALVKLGYAAPADEMMARLVRQFESPDGGLRRRAIERMSQLNATGAISVLTRGLKDSNGDVRLAAVQSFYNIGGRAYLPLLEPLVNDPNPEVAKEAQDLVEELKGREP